MNKNEKNKKCKYKEEIKQELMNNSITLSFALCIIIIGVFALAFKTNNIFLVGIALSALSLSIIQCFCNGNTMLNIIPILIMLIFGFFSESFEEIPIINIFSNSNVCNLVVFISLSVSFIVQSVRNIKYTHNYKKQQIKYNIEKKKLVLSQLSTMNEIEKNIVNLKKVNRNDKTYTKKLDELAKYIEEETFTSSVKTSLIVKGSEENKTAFDIEEVEESLLLSSNSIRKRKINADDDNEE